MRRWPGYTADHREDGFLDALHSSLPLTPGIEAAQSHSGTSHTHQRKARDCPGWWGWIAERGFFTHAG